MVGNVPDYQPFLFQVSPQLFNEPNVKFQPHGNLTLVTEVQRGSEWSATF